MTQYFDVRENRYKPVPDCSRVGLFWDTNSQRCERSELLGRVIRATRENDAASYGLGFLNPVGESGDDWGWWDWDFDYDFRADGNGGGFWDYFGDDGDWVGWGGGYDLPYSPMPDPFGYFPTAGIPGGSPYDPQGEYLYNLLYRPWAIDQGYGSAFAPPPTGGDSGNDWSWDNFWDWIKDTLAPSPTPNIDWPFRMPEDFPSDTSLPGYCPQGTYHPANDPYACVPFPNDPAAKKQAQQRQQQQQRAAQQARRAQQQQDKQCPKDPQGRSVWRNPQTGKCELAPQCPPNTKFDSTTRRCLSSAQLKQVYGDNNWLWWLIGGGVVLLLATRDRGGRRR